MPKCRFCDHNVPLGTTRCPNCGAPVDTATAQTEDLEQQVRSLLGQGQKLEAVKLYKDQTGASLRQAKEAVEAIEALAERHGIAAKGGGCVGVVLVFLALAVVVGTTIQ